jgi:cytochrome c-type biogenesis protein CcmH/NrfG
VDDETSQQAIHALKNQLNDDPQDFEAAVQLGNTYYDINNAPLSIVYYNVALGIRPNQPEIMTDMGTMYWRNGDIGLAEQCFRAVIATHPEFATAYLNLGLLLVRGKEEIKEGMTLWKKLLEDFPQHSATEKAKQFLAEINQ